MGTARDRLLKDHDSELTIPYPLPDQPLSFVQGELSAEMSGDRYLAAVRDHRDVGIF
jgi:hypothetical protein